MKRKHTIRCHLYTLLAGLLLFSGCSKSPVDDTPTVSPTASAVTVRFVADGTRDTTTNDSSTRFNDGAIDHVTGYLFVQGVLHEVLTGDPTSIEGFYTFRPSVVTGELYFVANAPDSCFDGVVPGVTSLSEFHTIDASIEELVSERIVMCGSMSLSEYAEAATVPLKRSVARIDLVSADRGVEVQQVTLRGIYDRGYIIGNTFAATPNEAATYDFTKDYADQPLTNGHETLLHLCEQENASLTAEILVTFGGGVHRLTTTLPARMVRNRIYTLRIHGAGGDAAVSVSSDDWMPGASAEATPAPKGLIDLEASTLPTGVTVSPTLDSVRVTHAGAAMRLVVRGEAGSEVEIAGDVRGVAATIESQLRQHEALATVMVTSKRRMPGEKRAYLHLNVQRDGIQSGRIVVIFEPHPVHFAGLLEVDEAGVCDFGRYLDGEIGRISLPEGKVARLAFDSSEDPWLQLVPTDEASTLRLLAGWKPNDPKADGREQEGCLVIENSDGSEVEEYIVRRRNWGLPVVRIGQTWWCKYNLRGNAREFSDQILIQDDPVADTDLADYLATCDDTELLRLMGDQYQGGNTNGLPLRYNGSAFYFEGMKGSAQHFATLDPTSMAPDGYQVPSYDDYAYLSGSQNYNLGGVGTRSYRNAAGDQLTIRIQERKAQYLGYSYGTVSLYEFRTETGCWVLYGLGHQWDTTAGNILPMMLLFATHCPNTNSWYMEGYAQNDRPNQNWLKYTAQNATKTRVLRCVKSPVEYIYE